MGEEQGKERSLARVRLLAGTVGSIVVLNFSSEALCLRSCAFREVEEEQSVGGG